MAEFPWQDCFFRNAYGPTIPIIILISAVHSSLTLYSLSSWSTGYISLENNTVFVNSHTLVENLEVKYKNAMETHYLLNTDWNEENLDAEIKGVFSIFLNDYIKKWEKKIVNAMKLFWKQSWTSYFKNI